MRYLRATCLTLFAAAVAAPAPAGADHRPAPEPGCAGLNFSDPRGDSPRGETDLLDAFLLAAPDGRVTFSVRLASLPEGRAPGYLGTSRYNLRYRANGTSYYAIAEVTEDSVSFQQGPEGRPISASTGDLHRGEPALLTFDLPVAPDSRVSELRIAAVPGAEVPDDDVASGMTQRAACPPPPPSAQPVAGPSRVVALRRWAKGFLVSVRPAGRGTVQLLRNGRRMRTVATDGQDVRIRVPRRRGTYRARFRGDDGAWVGSRPLRIRR